MKFHWFLCTLVGLAAASLFVSDALFAEGASLPSPVQESTEAVPKVPAVSLRGLIKFDGKHEPRDPIQVEGNTAKCCKNVPREDRSLLVDEKGGIANVVVTLTAKNFKRTLPKDPIEIDQRHCRFEPHVVIVPAGATLRFLNSDEGNHNVHTFPRKNPAMNVSMAPRQKLDRKLEYAETFRVSCDIHPWMNSWVHVTKATHFALTDEAGQFELTGVPDGTYQLRLWHEELGKAKIKQVVVKQGATTAVVYDWKPKPKQR